MENNRTAFEEKQYTDIWTNDEYLQFMYERLILMRELLADSGSIYVHSDWRVNAFIRLTMDEIFGADNFVNQIEWVYKTGGIPESIGFSKKHDHVLFYKKGKKPIFNPLYQKSYVPTLPEPHTNSGRRLGVMRDEICDLCTVGALVKNTETLLREMCGMTFHQFIATIHRLLDMILKSRKVCLNASSMLHPIPVILSSTVSWVAARRRQLL